MIRRCAVAVSLMLFGWILPGAAQPALVSDVAPETVDPQRQPSSLSDFISVGSRAVFLVGRADETQEGSELWATDGTDAGTERLRSFLGVRVSVVGGNGQVPFVLMSRQSYPE